MERLWSPSTEWDIPRLKQPYGLTLDAIRNRLIRIRMISDATDKEIKELSKKMEEITKSESKDEKYHVSRLEKHFQFEYLQAVLGIELAEKKQEEILLERQLVWKDRVADGISQNDLWDRYVALNRRYTSAGGSLWYNSTKKLRLENPNAIRSWRLDSIQHTGAVIPEFLLPLYKNQDDLDEKRKLDPRVLEAELRERKKPSNWIADVVEYYSAHMEYHGRDTNIANRWCHVTGTWHIAPPSPARIVPFLMDENKLAEIVFGNVSEPVQGPANALLLASGIHSLFEAYALIIVPVDRSETPIRRWRTEFVLNACENASFGIDYETGKHIYGRDIEGSELSFLGNRRPAPRFLYFHFIMTLIRSKDRGRQNWQQMWARYYEQRPFPSPGNYMRKSIIKALATYFDVADMNVVESWMSDHGFNTQLQFRNDQVTELARRVHRIVDVDATVDQSDSEEELYDSYGDTDDED
ncbi:hypothetical protein V8C35DRAFT_280386 [Trichoderma chlorosporum]